MARYRNRVETLAEAILDLRWSEMEKVAGMIEESISDSGTSLPDDFSLSTFLTSWAEYVDGEYRSEEK